MFCEKCGQEIANESRFCPSCGAANVNATQQEEVLVNQNTEPQTQESPIQEESVANEAGVITENAPPVYQAPFQEQKETLKEKELLEKAYGTSIKKIKDLLTVDKQKVKKSKFSETEQKDIILIIDMLANVIESEDKDAIDYAFISYKYMAKVHKIIFFGRVKKITALIKDIVKWVLRKEQKTNLTFTKVRF